MLSGVAGLSDIPILGRLFAANRKETRQTDIILTLTPHIVRVLDLSEIDLRPFRLGRDVSNISGGEPGLAPPPRDRVDAPGDSVQPPVETPQNRPLNPFFPYPLPSPTPGLPPLPGQIAPITPPKKPGGGGL